MLFRSKTKELTNYKAVDLLEPIYEKGKRVYDSPSLVEIQAFCKQELDNMWDEIKRFENPHRYYVDLSEKLWTLKTILLNEYDQHLRDMRSKDK